MEKGPPAAVETLFHIRPDQEAGRAVSGERSSGEEIPPAAVNSTLSKREDDAPEATAGGLTACWEDLQEMGRPPQLKNPLTSDQQEEGAAGGLWSCAI